MSDARYSRVEIDLSAIAHNVRLLKAFTRPGTLFMAVVKADAYGHGAVRVSRAAIGAGADRLGVATVEEAVELREAGIMVPIHLLSEPPPTTVPDLLRHELIPVVTTREFAIELGRQAAASDRVARYHIQIDTGMNRIGVRVEDAVEFVRGLQDFPGLMLEGVSTHFATAEVSGDWEFERQVERFERVLGELKTEGVNSGLVNAANSAATILHPETHYSMVRCGIAIYGLHPGASTRDVADLKPAMQVLTHVSLVKRIGMGEGVSYGLTWQASAPTVIATLPLGYGDGVHRVLSGKMDVLIGGVRRPQVGSITMDQLMVESGRGPDPIIGDEAVLVGSQGQQKILMDELAESAGTINHEIACAFGMRLSRRYV